MHWPVERVFDGVAPVSRVLRDLPTERINPRTRDLDQLASADLLAAINGEDAGVAQAVDREIPNIARALDAIHQRFARGGRLVYIGAGTSGRLGVLDAAEMPPTFGVDPGRVLGVMAGGPGAMFRSSEGAEDSERCGVQDLESLDLTADDCVVGIAASGRTPYVIGGLRYASQVGALTVALTTNPEGAIVEEAQIAIAPNVGPEVIAGSTRMKSGTAQKLVLNMLSTGLMVKMGYVEGNLMVNVQPTNDKLRARATRLVMQLAECDEARAWEALKKSGDVREAVRTIRRADNS